MISDRNVRTTADFIERTLVVPVPAHITKPTQKQVVLALGGQKTTSASSFFYNISAMRVTNVEFSLGATGGVHGTTTADVKDDGVSILSAAKDLSAATAGSKTSGTLSTAAGVTIAAGSKIELELVMTGGTNPTLDDVTVTITYEDSVATVAGFATIYNTTDWVVVDASAVCSAKAGTLTVCNVDILDDAVSIFATKPNIASTTAGNQAAGVLTTTTGVTVASGSKITFDFNATVTNGTVTGLVILVTYRTKAGVEVTSTEAP